MSESTDVAATQVCLLTAQGRSAVAVIGVSGPYALSAVASHFKPANRKPLATQARNRVIYGHWRREDLIVCRTGEDALEIHCHGGSRSSKRIIEDLVSAGGQRVDQEAWLAANSESTIQAEAGLALAFATTERAARHLLYQYRGTLEQEIKAIEEEIEQERFEAAAVKVDTLLDWKEFGLHLTQPWRIVIAGPPNVGKSSLINAIAGYQRAIVFDQPGTTRDVVTAVTALDGWPVTMSDTAGLHDTGDSLEVAGIERAQQEIRKADLVLWVLDATLFSEASGANVKAIAEQQARQAGLSLDEQRCLIVVNKIDLAVSITSLEGEFTAVSAKYETGLSELITTAMAKLVPCVPQEHEPVPFNFRQIDGLETLSQSLRASQRAEASEVCQRLLHERL